MANVTVSKTAKVVPLFSTLQNAPLLQATGELLKALMKCRHRIALRYADSILPAANTMLKACIELKGQFRGEGFSQELLASIGDVEIPEANLTGLGAWAVEHCDSQLHLQTVATHWLFKCFKYMSCWEERTRTVSTADVEPSAQRINRGGRDNDQHCSACIQGSERVHETRECT